MKKIISLLILSMVMLIAGSLTANAQGNWKTFSSAKVSYQSSYKGSFSVVDPSDGLWMVYLGKEVQKGVYVLLDEDRHNTGNLINLKKSGYTGWWGWLSPKDADSNRSARQRGQKATFYPGVYELMIQDD